MNTSTKVILLIVNIIVSTNLKAQEEEHALAKCCYNFVHINDTTQRSKHHDEEMVLYMGKDASLYQTYTEERMKERVAKQMEDPAFDGNLTIKGNARTTSESYYFQPVDKNFKELYKLGNERYLLDDTYPEIRWKISNEVKEIGGYSCQRADTELKGRKYTVWFTLELPFSYGPWKLQGLPGLILEAKDSRDEVFFHYAGFDKMEKDSILFGVPDNLIKTSRKALTKLKEAFKKNPQAVASAKSKGQSGSLVRSAPSATLLGDPLADPSRIKSITVQKADDSDKVSAVTNNPIELQD